MFRVLSLDGGGIKGVFSAAALGRMEEQHKCRIIDHFDLIVGTSTGGIIALGLALGISPNAILDFYIQKGGSIFPGSNRFTKNIYRFKQFFIAPKYSSKLLRESLKEIFKEATLSDAQCKVVIPSFDAVANRIYLFKTPHGNLLHNDAKTSIVEVAMATSAAPTYFEAASTVNKGKYVDGGVWANDPTMVGIVEATTFLKVPISDIDVLSIGTTSTPFSMHDRTNASASRWNIKMVDLILEAQAQACQAQSKLLLDNRMLRINHNTERGRFSLDDASANSIVNLQRLGVIEAEKKAVYTEVKQRFLNGTKVEKFVPSY